MYNWNLNANINYYTTIIGINEQVINVNFGLNVNNNINHIGNFDFDLPFLLAHGFIRIEGNNISYRIKIYRDNDQYYISRTRNRNPRFMLIPNQI